MAITDAKKVDYLWKKIGYGATKTDTNAAKKAPNEAIASPLLLRGDKVWTEANNIPGTQPGSSSGVVTVYPASTPDETTNDGTAAANRTWKTGHTDWIPPEIGSTYQVKVTYTHHQMPQVHQVVIKCLLQVQVMMTNGSLIINQVCYTLLVQTCPTV